MADDDKVVGVVFLPLPVAGHLMSTVEMAKHFLQGRRHHHHHHRFSVTVLTMPLFAPSSEVSSYVDAVASSGLDIHFEELPPPFGEPIPEENQSPEAFISVAVGRHKPRVKDAISRRLASPSAAPISAIVMDFFSTSMIDVANELGIPPYIYFTSGASMLGLMLYLPTLHEKVPLEFSDVEGMIDIPGLPSAVPPLSMPTPLMDKKDSAYTWFLHHARRFREVRGIMVNTFAELEPAALESLWKGLFSPDHPPPPVYPVGPLLALRMNAGPEHDCLRWLDGQPPASVVFLCFGSEGSFPEAQVKEMAVGLERSGLRFLWVLRSPSKERAIGLPTDTENLEEVLPEGFLERTRGRGLVWPSWAPQPEILAHPSTGGFVTHCGWNSCLESLWFGVPMLVWPLYAEQHFNAFIMARDLGVAVAMEVDREGGNFVTAGELERGVRCLMGEEDDFGGEQGWKVRAKVKEMREASRKALEEGGSSFDTLQRLAEELIGGASSPPN